MRRRLACVALLTACAAPGPADHHGVPAHYALVVSEDFDDASSLERFAFSDPDAWRWHPDGALELAGESDYEPPNRSPRSIAILPGVLAADFVLEADLCQTGREYGHRDLCAFLAFVSPSRYVYTHLATTPDPNAHNVFLVEDAPRRPLAPVAESGVDWDSREWHRLRIERRGTTVRIFFDDMQRPLITADDLPARAGCVGLGSFDDVGRFDNLRVWAPELDEAAVPPDDAIRMWNGDDE